MLELTGSVVTRCFCGVTEPNENAVVIDPITGKNTVTTYLKVKEVCSLLSNLFALIKYSENAYNKKCVSMRTNLIFEYFRLS